MQHKSIRAGLTPLLWGAILFLIIAAALLAIRQPGTQIPTDAVYVIAKGAAL